MPPENQQHPGAPQPLPDSGSPQLPQIPQPGQPSPAQPYEFPARPREPEQSPYDFFMESQKTARRGPLLDASPAKKLLMIIGVIFVVMALLATILAIATKPSGSGTALLTIAQEQTELIRVAGDAVKNSHDGDIQNFAATLQVGLTSAQIELTDYMAKTGTKASEKTLSLGHSAKTDQALSAALAADTYDTTFESIMRADLNTYVHDLTQEYNAATTKTEQQIIQKDLDGAALLQKMLPQPAQ